MIMFRCIYLYYMHCRESGNNNTTQFTKFLNKSVTGGGVCMPVLDIYMSP